MSKARRDAAGQPVKIAAADLELAAKRMAMARQLRDLRTRNPIEWYEPGNPGNRSVDGRILGEHAGQQRFHESKAKYRILAPGNGWGKSTAMGAEAHWWATHTHPFQRTPKWPVLMVWFVKLRAQFELMRVQLTDKVFGAAAVWKNGRFLWPDGSQMFLASADRSQDWQKWQGPPVDLLLFDEQPPRRLWEEMTMRRRADRKTKYVIGATATTGNSWIEPMLFRPWLKYHADIGLDEDRAMQMQAHPGLFVWAKGGIEDNPAADQDDIDHYLEATANMHKNEQHVRLKGGFRSWTGDAVFDADIITALDATCAELEEEMGFGELGMFTPNVPKGRRAA